MIVTVSSSAIVAPVTSSVMTAPTVESIPVIDPPATPPSVKLVAVTVFSVSDSSAVTAICEVDTVTALENIGLVESIPGAVAAMIVIISVPAFPAASSSVILTSSAFASRTSPSPSATRVSVIV